ncbi:hypothetical protein J1N35_022975 [Gossypium stocksii]|uniref:Uncharacterized protein n=1 Tax=Gossypium stocksii TaxID=47602 RepID=A0A9D4A404_9ROSI|nr:hypothetical protein J1N35_022975 [Gossypium stocksii]
MAHNASHRGLPLTCESFGPQELARFKELLEKTVRLKLGWPNNEDMAILATLVNRETNLRRLKGIISCTVKMVKEITDQEWAKKPILLKDMLLDVDEQVDKLKEPIKDINDRIDDWMEQSRDYMTMSLNSTIDKVNKLLNSHRNDTLEAMIMALKQETIAMIKALSTRIEEL